MDKAVESYKKLNENYVKEAGMEMSDFLKAQGMSEEDYEEDCQQYAESKVEQNLSCSGNHGCRRHSALMMTIYRH